jgi:hypothetical protein
MPGRVMAMNENTFTMKSWDEHVAGGGDGSPRYAHARAVFDYSGAIQGTSTCDYLLYYAGAGYETEEQTGSGLERIEGSVGGHSGSFVIRHEATYGPDGIRLAFTVVPGSGTGELAGLSGSGTATGASETMHYTFDYTLP